MSTTKDQGPDPVTKPNWTHRWALRRVLPQQYGKLCRIVPKDLPRGYTNAKGQWWAKVTVEFADGTRAEASRASLRALTYGSSERTGRPSRKVVGVD